MDRTHIVALAKNILRFTSTLATHISIPDVNPCSLCGKEIYSLASNPQYKEFTLASCGHIFHQKCLEKHLVSAEAICPNKECAKVIETFLAPDFSKDRRNEKDGDKETGLDVESTKSPADEMNTTTTELANTTATVATALQVDSENPTPVDDINNPLEPESHAEVQLTESTRDNLPEVNEERSDRGQEMDVDNTGVVGEDENGDEVEVQVNSDSASNKRASTSTDKPSSKKAKTKVEDSRVLKNLIRELSIGTLKVSEVREKGLFRLQQEVGNSRIFLTLYSKITNAEEKHENTNQDVIRTYYFFGEALSRRLDQLKKTKEEHVAQELLNDEVRKQLPKEVTKNALRKRTEKARKIYDLFRRIGADKIQRVRSFSASRIARLSGDKIDYVVKEVIALL